MKRRHLALLALALAGYGWLSATARERLRERRRTPEVSLETAEDPAIARGYLRVNQMPQFRLMRALVARRVLSAGDGRGGRALDVGSGPGLLALELARRAPELEVVGLDLSEDMIEMATAHARAAGVAGRVTFAHGAAENIPFPDGFFDVVTSTLSLHHWSDPVRVLDEIARVLAPGGVFLVGDLRRDVSPLGWGLVWLATHAVVPRALREIAEPLNSLYSAFTRAEAEELATRSHLTYWQVTKGPLWLLIESA